MHGLHKCPINSDWQFACSRSSSIPNLICIHKSWVCDQDNDCPDGEDEENCGELTFLKISQFSKNRILKIELTFLKIVLESNYVLVDFRNTGRLLEIFNFSEVF